MNNTTKRVFSAIAKKDNVELKAEKIELGLADKAIKVIERVKKEESKVNKELDSAFTPIRQLESAIERLKDSIPSKIESFATFKDLLMNLETEYIKALSELRDAENKLGVKIDMPKDLSKVANELEKLQKSEEIFRKEITEFNKLSKKFKSLK